MPELGPYGSVRGARGNSRPYRESNLRTALNPATKACPTPLNPSDIGNPALEDQS
jgi:hypothetical protein